VSKVVIVWTRWGFTRIRGDLHKFDITDEIKSQTCWRLSPLGKEHDNVFEITITVSNPDFQHTCVANYFPRSCKTEKKRSYSYEPLRKIYAISLRTKSFWQQNESQVRRYVTLTIYTKSLPAARSSEDGGVRSWWPTAERGDRSIRLRGDCVSEEERNAGLEWQKYPFTSS
jgi:hypothetical protein